MNVDLTKLVTNLENKLIIDISVDFDESKLEKENIRKLDNVFFKGEITKLCDENFQISGTLSGTMVLPDDITGEDVFQKFSTSLEEELQKEKKSPFGCLDNYLGKE